MKFKTNIFKYQVNNVNCQYLRELNSHGFIVQSILFEYNQITAALEKVSYGILCDHGLRLDILG
jgi:hypothetical protein